MALQAPLNVVPSVTSIQDMILRSARVYGDKIALEDLKEYPIPRLTYSALLRNILKFGVALRAMGIKERSHVAVIGENRVQWSLAYLTSMCFNYVVVPVDRALMSNEILNILHESDASAVIYSDAYEPLLRESRASMKNLKFYINMDIPSRKEKAFSMVELVERSPGCSPEQLPRINPEELAEIIFTSGSLGRAKGVMLSQLNLAENLMAMTKMVRITSEDRFLGVLPIHHTYACTCGFLCPMFMGSSVHFAQSLKTIVDDLQTVHATILLSVPLMYDKMFKAVYKTIQQKKLTSMIVGPLIRAGAVVEKFGWKSFRRTVFGEIHEKFGGSIRLFIAGGAAQDPLVAKGLREFGFCFIQGYGLTETGPILTLNRVENFKDDSAGIPLPGVTLRIAAPDHLGIGEIWARGKNVMLGYYQERRRHAGGVRGRLVQDGRPRPHRRRRVPAHHGEDEKRHHLQERRERLSRRARGPSQPQPVRHGIARLRRGRREAGGDHRRAGRRRRRCVHRAGGNEGEGDHPRSHEVRDRRGDRRREQGGCPVQADQEILHP